MFTRSTTATTRCARSVTRVASWVTTWAFLSLVFIQVSGESPTKLTAKFLSNGCKTNSDDDGTGGGGGVPGDSHAVSVAIKYSDFNLLFICLCLLFVFT